MAEQIFGMGMQESKDFSAHNHIKSDETRFLIQAGRLVERKLNHRQRYRLDRRNNFLRAKRGISTDSLYLL